MLEVVYIKIINFLKLLFTDNKHLVQRLTLEQNMKQRGCVNSLQWNETGTLLLSAGDDKRIVIINPFTYQHVVDYKTKHQTNIYCAKFLPTLDNRVISCGADGSILSTGKYIIYFIYHQSMYIITYSICIYVLDLERQIETEWDFFTCHESTCYELETIPGDPNTFLSCSEDSTVRLYDLRTSSFCSKIQCRDVNEIIIFIFVHTNTNHNFSIAYID